MRGGVYFKLICILNKLINLSPSEDYSHLLQKITIGLVKHKLSTSPDSRGPLDAEINSVAQVHREYYMSNDEPICLVEGEDVSLYLTDYILFRIAEFLTQKHSILDDHILKAYSKIFFNVLQRYPGIGKDISETNLYCRVLSYEDIRKLKAMNGNTSFTESTAKSSNNNNVLMVPSFEGQYRMHSPSSRSNHRA